MPFRPLSLTIKTSLWRTQPQEIPSNCFQPFNTAILNVYTLIGFYKLHNSATFHQLNVTVLIQPSVSSLICNNIFFSVNLFWWLRICHLLQHFGFEFIQLAHKVSFVNAASWNCHLMAFLPLVPCYYMKRI